MWTVRKLCILSVILFIEGIRSIRNAESEAASSRYSNSDVCSDSSHTVLDEKWREVGSETSGKCDEKLQEGWYRFLINGKNAQLPTLCIKNKACGTVVPLRLDLQGMQLPPVNHSIRASVCGSYTILHKWDCCVLRQPALVHNCGAFYVYRLSPPDRCDVGYCVISDGDLMKMHAFTAKTGEPSHERPKPTYLPSTTKEKGCSSNERRCPDGCVPLSQSCPMTLDFNPVHVQRRIVHTFDTIRQKHYFTITTRKTTKAITTTHAVTEPREGSTGHHTQPIYRYEPFPSTTERPKASTNINRSVFTTVISAITTAENEGSPTTDREDSVPSTAAVVSASHESGTGATEGIKDLLDDSTKSTLSDGDRKRTESTDVTTHEMSEATVEKSRVTTTSTSPTGDHTGVHHDNQNEQPVAGNTYCGVILAFEFEASYAQNTNFTRFRKRLQVVFASLLNIYYVDNHGLYMNGIFSWRTRYHRDTVKSYTSTQVHFGQGIHNQSYYFITLFAEDIFNAVLYLPDRVISTLLHNSTVISYIQREIKDFHVTFVNTTTNKTEVMSTEVPPRSTPLLFANLGLCMAAVVLISICLVCGLIAILKAKSKNRCMKLRRKSGQYYVKWEQALKRDVCKGIEYIENPVKDKEIDKSDISVKQNLISPKDKDSREEEENAANDLRGKERTRDSFWAGTSTGYHESDVVQGLQTKL